MGLADKIVRHPRAVIAIWIIIIVLAAPLAIKLDEVLSYEETGFLPENTESVKADNILQEKFNISAEAIGISMLLITGIDASDPNAWDSYKEFREKVEGVYAENLTSYYDIHENIEEQSKNISIFIVEQLANTTTMMKNFTEQLVEGYGLFLNQSYMMYNIVSMTKMMLINTSNEYHVLVDNITQLHQLIYGVHDTIKGLDEGYAVLKENLTMLYKLMMMLKNSIKEYNNAVYSIDYTYSLLYYNVTRTFYYLAYATDAYTNGTLDQNDIATIIYYTNMSSLGPVEPELVVVVFNVTYGMVGNNTSIVDDYMLANITKEILLNQLSSQVSGDELYLLEELTNMYHNAFVNTLAVNETQDNKLILDTYTLNTSLAGASQDKALLVIESVGDKAVKSLTKPLADLIYQQASSAGYSIPYEMALLIANESIELGPMPTSNDLKNAVINATIASISSMNTSIPIPETELRSILETIYSQGLTTPVLQEIYRTIVESEAKNYPPPMNTTILLCLDKVLALDPDATGSLAEDEKLLRDLTIDVVSTMLTSMGAPKEFMGLVEKLYDLGESPNPEVFEDLAKDILVNMTNKMIEENITFLPENIQLMNMSKEDLREFIMAVIEKAIEINPDNETAVYLATKDVVFNITSKMMKEMNITATINLTQLFDALYNLGSNATFNDVKTVVTPIFREEAAKMLENIPVDVPEDIVEKLNNTIEWVIENYPLNETDVKQYVVSLVYNMTTSFAEENAVMKDVLSRIDLEKIIEELYGYEEVNATVVESIVDEIKPVLENIFLDYMKAYLETLKSSDDTTLLILFAPLGSDDDEKYDNALKIKEIAEELFGKHFSSVQTYVAGGVVTAKELENVGRQDISKVQKYSYLLTLIILFIVVEAIFATIIPFISIGAAIMVASAIVYFIAAHVMDISSWARILMTTTALGLGIDYTTYYLHRLKEYLDKGMPLTEAAAEALRRARDGIMASASTDIIGFAALMIAWDFPFLRVIGVTVPIAIFSVFLASLTLIPAITVIVGGSRAFWWPRRIGKKASSVLRESKLVNGVIKARYLVIVLIILFSIPATQAFLAFKGSHDLELYLPEGTQTREAYLLLEEKIGATATSPTYVVLVFNKPVGDNELALIERISSEIARLKYVKIVYGPTRPFGEPLENLTLEYVEAYNGTAFISDDKKVVMLRVIFSVPGESDEARDTVKTIRSIVRKYIDPHGPLVEAYTGGISAAFVDLDELLQYNFWHRIIPVSVVLMFLALVFSLRGVIAALVTMSTIYVGITWSIWFSGILFQKFFGKPLLWFLPLVILVVLLGVGVDYNSFYLVKARDEMERLDPRKALSVAARTSGKLIVGLALILVSSYSSLMLTSMWAIKEMGFVLSSGILFIAVSAVYIMAPAVIAVFGRRTWWPFKVGGRGIKSKADEVG